MSVKTDEEYMSHALKLAKMAYSLGEAPIGAVVVDTLTGDIIGEGYNLRETEKSPLAHAEIIAIDKASKKLGGWRVVHSTLYVTLEPCPMCAGAIVQARIPRVVIGSRNPKAGCAGSVLDLLHEKGFNHQADLEGGVLEADCTNMLQAFFRELRQEKNADIGKA